MARISPSFTDGPVGGIPAGTTVRPASDLMPRPDWLPGVPDRKALAVWSDYIRLRLSRTGSCGWTWMRIAFAPSTSRARMSSARMAKAGSSAASLGCRRISGADLEHRGCSNQVSPGKYWWMVRKQRAAGRLGPLACPGAKRGGARGLVSMEAARIVSRSRRRRSRSSPQDHPAALWSLGFWNARAIVAPELRCRCIWFGFTKRLLGDAIPAARATGRQRLVRMAGRHGLVLRDAPARAAARSPAASLSRSAPAGRPR